MNVIDVSLIHPFDHWGHKGITVILLYSQFPKLWEITSCHLQVSLTVAFCYSTSKWTKTSPQAWSHPVVVTNLGLLWRWQGSPPALCSTSLYILAPTEGEKVPGYNSPLRPTGSVQRAYGTQTLFRGECRWVVWVWWCRWVCMCFFSFPVPSPLSISLCNVKTQIQNLLHSTQLLYHWTTSQQHPPSTTFCSITMDAAHESLRLHWSSVWKPSSAISMQTRCVIEGKPTDGLSSFHPSSPADTQATVPVLAQESAAEKSAH